jgi:hypothetical protein
MRLLLDSCVWGPVADELQAGALVVAQPDRIRIRRAEEEL